MTTSTKTTPKQRIFTIEEVDSNLSTLANIHKHSRYCNIDSVNKRIDLWLDRRLRLREIGGE